MTERTITIGSRYLKEGIKRDYNNWQYAWARECAQNSIDAGSTHVYISVTEDDDSNTVVNWSDNGCGMTEDIVINKLMALGETTKTNGTGGFGVAFALIGLAQLSYVIRTNDIIVRGSGSKYKIEKADSPNKGTSLTVTMDGDEEGRIRCAIKRWINLSSCKTKFYLNNEEVQTFRRHKPKAETPWCKIYTANNTGYMDKVYVRMNGQLMFSVYSRVENVNVIVDLQGESLEYLTSNRDGLNYLWNSKLQALIQELFENPNKIKQAEDHTTVWRGTKGLLRFEGEQKPAKMKLNQPMLARPTSTTAALDIASAIPNRNQVKPLYEAKTEKEIKTLIDGYDVVVVNRTNQPIPEKFIPGQMSKHAYAVLNRWIRVVQAAGIILDMSQAVCIGFVFSGTARAAHKYTEEFGHMILVNPINVNEKETRFVNQWNNSTASFSEMVGAAVHELTHIGNSNHNAEFATSLTYDIPKVMSRTTILNKIKKDTKV